MKNTIENIFKNDPIYMQSFVGKKVEVQLRDQTWTGIVSSIDPIYKTVVLHDNWVSETDYRTVFIFFNSIRGITVLSDEVIESYLNRPKSPQQIEDEPRKNLIKKWLEHMRLDFIEVGDYLKVEEHLVIAPPYQPETCICTNTIILERVQNIMRRMPPDFN